MDFSNERYVRLFVRDTTTWLMLEFEGQTVLMHLLRKADRAGVIDLAGREPWSAPVVHCRIPVEFARRGMEACLREGVVVHDGDRLVFPRYIEANECAMSDKQRAKDSRDKRAALSRNVTAPSQNVSPPSQSVTDGHTESHGVTPCRAVPNRTEPERDARAREEQAPDQNIESDRRRGSDFMLEATARSWQGYDRDLALIGAKPRAELLRALDAIRGDPWCRANMTKVSPAHVVRKWNDYSAGAPPMQLGAAKQPAPTNTAALSNVLKELAAARESAKRAEPESWERTKAQNTIAELEQRANKLRSA